MTDDRDLSRQLMKLTASGGLAGRLSLALPLLAGGLLVLQAWLLARILHAAVVSGASLDRLVLPILGVLGLVAGRAALGAAGEMLAVAASEGIKRGLRRRLFGAMLGRQPCWTAAQASGALSTLVIEQIEALDGFLVRYLPALVQASLLPLAFAVLILPFDWIVALIFLGTAPLIPVFMMLAGWGAEAAARAQAHALARLTGRFADRLRGMVTLKLFGREAAETEAMFEASEELRGRSMKVMRTAFLSSAVLEFFAALGVAGVALYCGLSLLGLLHLRGAPLTLETALFCLLMAPEVYQPLRLLAAHYHDRAAGKAALREIEVAMGSWLAPAAARPPLPAGTAAGGFSLPLRVSGLGLATPGGRPLLAGLELELRPGEHVAILGPSGIGKSTLVEALARLRPFEGSARLGDTELAALPEAALRAFVAFVGQRPRLFAGSIADNIRLGRPAAPDAAVREAADRALVTAFTDQLPAGLDTIVGEAGLGLSGGEAQRIALARLYLRDPALILLDEPTSHLDGATESRVLERLLAFAEGRMMIIATHSPAAAARMDRVYRIAGGTLLEAPRPRLRPAGALVGAA